MKKQQRIYKAIHFYSYLLNLYPKEYQKSFRSEMTQTFIDHYNDVIEIEGLACNSFWTSVITDELVSIVKEQSINLKGGVRMKNRWLQQGLIFGVILGAFQLIYNLINNLAPANGSLNSILNLSLVLVPVLCGVAGYMSSKKDKSIKVGAYAGLVTESLSIGIGIISLFVITFLFMNTISHNAFMLQDFHRSGVKSMQQFVIEDAMGAASVGVIVSLFSGALFGAIGAGIRKLK